MPPKERHEPKRSRTSNSAASIVTLRINRFVAQHEICRKWIARLLRSADCKYRQRPGEVDARANGVTEHLLPQEFSVDRYMEDGMNTFALQWFTEMQAGRFDRTQLTAAYNAQLTDDAVQTMSRRLNEYGAPPEQRQNTAKPHDRGPDIPSG